jgi:hypothetical protein
MCPNCQNEAKLPLKPHVDRRPFCFFDVVEDEIREENVERPAGEANQRDGAMDRQGRLENELVAPRFLQTKLCPRNIQVTLVFDSTKRNKLVD